MWRDKENVISECIRMTKNANRCVGKRKIVEKLDRERCECMRTREFEKEKKKEREIEGEGKRKTEKG